MPFISNEEELKKLVYNKDNPYWITWSILEKIKDEEFLIQAFGDATLNGNGGALRNIHNEDFLRDLIQTTDNSDYFEVAVHNLTDKKLLRQIALDTSIEKFYSHARTVAARKLGDKKLIWDMIQTDPDFDVRVGLIYSIGDQEKLKGLLFSELPAHLRVIALTQIKDQSTYIKAATTSTAAEVRREAVKRIDDPKILQEIYYENSGSYLWEVRNHLVGKLSDQHLLQKIYEEELHETVRISALEKLTDKSFLANLSMNDPSDRVRLAAENRTTRLTKLVSEKSRSMPTVQGNPEFIRKIKHLGINLPDNIFQPARHEGYKLLSCPNCQFVVGENDPTCSNCGELMPIMKASLGVRDHESTSQQKKEI